GRARSAPYHPVADPAPAPAVPQPPERSHTEDLPEPEQEWLRRTAWTLVTQARENPVYYATSPVAALDRFLDTHLRTRPEAIPSAWARAVHDDDTRADLLDTLVDLVAAVE
ncbi:hypothetical protein ACFQZU_20975, partial [Streptomonospora algeriensis]